MREDFHTPGGHDHDQKSHAPKGSDGWDEDKPDTGDRETQYHTRTVKAANASAAKKARRDLYEDLTERGYKLVDSHPQDGDVYIKAEDASSKYTGYTKIKVAPVAVDSRGSGGDQHGSTLKIIRSRKEFFDDQQRDAVKSSTPVELRTDFEKKKRKMSEDGEPVRAINGAEIFSVGKWNGIEFSETDLDLILHAFNELQMGGRVPLKFGHNDKQPMTDGQPALGWVNRIWKDGGKLFADFVNMPTTVYNAIKNHLYKFVSVELLKDAERNGSKYPWVLSGVALLGADLPAVGGLKDLTALTMADAGLRFKSIVAFRHAGDNLKGESSNMADEKLMEELAALKAKVVTLSSENETVKLERDKEREERLKEKAKAIKESVELRFEQAIEAKQLKPVSRELFFKWTFPKDDAAIAAFDPKDAEKFIEENKVKMSDDNRPAGKPARDDEEGKGPDEVLVQRAKLLMSQRQGVTYLQAAEEVLAEDPKLADDYRFMTGSTK